MKRFAHVNLLLLILLSTSISLAQVDPDGDNDCGGEPGDASDICALIAPTTLNSKDSQIICPASSINIDQLSLSESISVVGAPFSLNYVSDRVPGRKASFKASVPIFGDASTLGFIKHVDFEIQYAGFDIKKSYDMAPNISYDLSWDGVNASGKLLNTSTQVTAIWKSTDINGKISTQTFSFLLGLYQPKFLGLGGWTPSILHFYDTQAQRIYTGDGGIRNIQAVATANGGFYLTDQNGLEVYYFDSQGRHMQTKNALTGDLKYSFNYDSLGRISSIVDAFNNMTQFNYQNSSSARIKAPFGQESILNFDSNGWLISLRNPNNETFHLSMSSLGLLTAYQKPAGQKNEYVYDNDGYIIKDIGAGGNFLSFVKQIDNSFQNVTSTSALGRQTQYQTLVYTTAGTDSDHQTTNPDGTSSTSYVTSLDGVKMRR